MHYRIPYIGGNTKGRDHWPFPTSTLTAPMNTDTYPIKPGTDTLCRWLWRVKTWELTGSIAIDFTNTDPISLAFCEGTITATYDFLAPSIHPPSGSGSNMANTTELNLIPGVNGAAQIGASFAPMVSGTSFTGSGATFQDVGSGVFTMTATCSGSFGNPPASAFLLTADVSASFSLQHSFNPIGWNETEGAAPVLDISTAVLMQLGPRSSGNITAQIVADSSTDGGFATHVEPDNILDGLNVPMYSATNLSSTSMTLVSHTVSPVTITPIEFWPFVNSQGQPVYDTGSGAIINDPFS